MHDAVKAFITTWLRDHQDVINAAMALEAAKPESDYGAIARCLAEYKPEPGRLSPKRSAAMIALQTSIRSPESNPKTVLGGGLSAPPVPH